MSKTQLPLFEDKTLLPNGKHHVSYSELSDWIDCSYRHELKHVRKINLESGGIHTAFGKAIHDAVEQYITTKNMPSVKSVIKEFHKMVEELDEGRNKAEAMAKKATFDGYVEHMLKGIPDWLDEQFPGWTIVDAEHYLFESIKNQPNVNFKGYIDAVLKVPKKRGRGFDYWIIDWKTAGWGWKSDQKRDFQKQLQLVLYKHYFCEKMGLDLKDVKCGFALIKRTPSNKDEALELVPVSVGPKAIDKGLKRLNMMLNSMRSGLTTKNRWKCRPFCPYLNTEHCI